MVPSKRQMAALFVLTFAGWVLGRSVSNVDGFFDELGQWDAAWYHTIAQSGYGPIADEAIRFFALFPTLGAVVDLLAPWSLGVSMLLIAWVSAYLGLRRVAVLAQTATGSTEAVRLTKWAVVLWPASISLIMAYPTGITLLATSATLIALTPAVTSTANRPRGLATDAVNWSQVAMWSAIASLARPTGLLLVVPILIVLASERPKRPLPWLAVVAPFSGVITMSLISLRHGRGLAAWSDVQAPLRGQWVDPISRIATGVVDLAGRDFGDGLHLGTVAILVGLTLVAWRKLPLPWAAHATAVLLLITAVENWNSIERYAYDMPQLAVAAALVMQRGWRRRVAIVSCVGAVSVVVLVMAGEFVP